jgi:hypothetical protein
MDISPSPKRIRLGELWDGVSRGEHNPDLRPYPEEDGASDSSSISIMDLVSSDGEASPGQPNRTSTLPEEEICFGAVFCLIQIFSILEFTS